MRVVCKTLLVVQVFLVLSCEVESCDPAGGAGVELEAAGWCPENLREKVIKKQLPVCCSYS